MLARPSPSRTYSTKSVEFARRVSPVRWSSTLRPDEPGTKWTRSPPMSACGAPARSCSQNDEGASAIAFSTTSRGNRTRSPEWSSGRPCSRRRRRISGPADLHPDLGEDPHGLVDDPGDELRLQDVEGRPHQGSSGVYRTHRDGVPPAYPARASTGWSGMGIPLPLASRLMRHPVASGATGGSWPRAASRAQPRLAQRGSQAVARPPGRRRSAADPRIGAWISRPGSQPLVRQTRTRVAGAGRLVRMTRGSPGPAMVTSKRSGSPATETRAGMAFAGAASSLADPPAPARRDRRARLQRTWRRPSTNLRGAGSGSRR